MRVCAKKFIGVWGGGGGVDGSLVVLKCTVLAATGCREARPRRRPLRTWAESSM